MNDKYYELLNANLDCETLERNIEMLANNKQYNNKCFITPKNKIYWEDAAKVLEKRGYPMIDDVIMDMFEWLQDLNWPGALIIVRILKSIPKKVFVDNLEKTIEIALKENDEVWLNWLYIFVYQKVVRIDDFTNKDLFYILNSHSEYFL